MKLILALVTLALNLNAVPFLVSEIFPNTQGRSRDQGYEWIEITNISAATIMVKDLTLSLHERNGAPNFVRKIDFLEPLEFSSTLLIAQQKNLGLNQCPLAAPVAVIADFSLPNSGTQKICVTINQDKNCLVIDKKIKRPDGTSLFRDLADINETPLLRPEPCHLAHGVYATPGINSRACLAHRDMASLIFSNCTEHEKSPPPVVMHWSAPTIPLAIDRCELIREQKIVKLACRALTQQEPMRVHQCLSPASSSTICHRQTSPQIIDGAHPHALWPLTSQAHEKVYLEIRDINGAENIVHVDGSANEENGPNGGLGSISCSSDGDRIKFSLALTSAALPINLAFLAANGEVLLTRAFVDGAKLTITLPLSSKPPPVQIRVCSQKGCITSPLNRCYERRETIQI